MSIENVERLATSKRACIAQSISSSTICSMSTQYYTAAPRIADLLDHRLHSATSRIMAFLANKGLKRWETNGTRRCARAGCLYIRKQRAPASILEANDVGMHISRHHDQLKRQPFLFGAVSTTRHFHIRVPNELALCTRNPLERSNTGIHRQRWTSSGLRRPVLDQRLKGKFQIRMHRAVRVFRVLPSMNMLSPIVYRYAP